MQLELDKSNPPVFGHEGARPALFQNFCVVLRIVCFVPLCVFCV